MDWGKFGGVKCLLADSVMHESKNELSNKGDCDDETENLMTRCIAFGLQNSLVKMPNGMRSTYPVVHCPNIYSE